MIEEGSSEEIKFAVLSTVWNPDIEEVAAAANQLRREGAKIIWADITQSLTCSNAAIQFQFGDPKTTSNYVVVCYWFEKRMDQQRERMLTVRAARAVKMYPYQWLRVPVTHASVKGNKNLPDPKLDSRSTVLQVWLSEHLCR